MHCVTEAVEGRTGPNGLALRLSEQIAELEAAKALCRTRVERRPINQQLHTLRGLLAWCESRAGYQPPLLDAG